MSLLIHVCSSLPVQWAFLLAVPFFTSKKKDYDVYEKH